MEPLEFRTRPQSFPLNPLDWIAPVVRCMAYGIVAAVVAGVALALVESIISVHVAEVGAGIGFFIGIVGLVIYKIKKMSDSHGTRWVISDEGITIYKFGAKTFATRWNEVRRLELYEVRDPECRDESAMVIETMGGTIRLSDNDFHSSDFLEMRRLIRLLSPPASKILK